jgi:hypothetical protein
VASEEDLNAVRETIRKAGTRMDQAPWGTGKTMSEDSHCLVGWAFTMAQEQVKPLTRWQRCKQKLGTLGYNIDLITQIVRHPLTDHYLDTEVW